jgi:hypothetical protein
MISRATKKLLGTNNFNQQLLYMVATHHKMHSLEQFEGEAVEKISSPCGCTLVRKGNVTLLPTKLRGGGTMDRDDMGRCSGTGSRGGMVV